MKRKITFKTKLMAVREEVSYPLFKEWMDEAKLVTNSEVYQGYEKLRRVSAYILNEYRNHYYG